MPVSPVTISRVSQNSQMQVLINGMRRSMVQLLQKQEQLATGLRVLRPSDNPIDTTAGMRLEDLLEAQQQYLANVDHASKVMNLADATLTSVRDLVIEAHNLALENVGSTADADQREAAATLVDSIIGQLVTLGNTEYLGTYLFAGNISNAAPFAQEDSLVSFSGDQSQVAIQVADEIAEQINLTAGDVFGTGSGKVSSDHDLAPGAVETTRLIDVAGAMGRGIRSGTLVVVGSQIGQVEIDLTGAATVGDVIEKANSVLPSSVHLSLDADGRRLWLESSNGGETLQVLEAGQGTIAHDLGLYTATAQVGPVIGSDFAPKLTGQTDVSALAGNSGIDLTSGIVITNGANSITVDFTTAQTVQDILAAINAAEAGVRARINDEGTGIEIISTLAGAELRITENGGTTAADLGIRTFKENTALADLNGGLGVNTVAGNDFRIIASDGSTVDVDVSDAVTVGDVIDRINSAAAAASVAVVAGTGTTGGGIVLTDNTGGTGVLAVERLNLSNAAKELGIFKAAETGSSQIIGDDVNPIREHSIFTYLIDLRDGLAGNDTRRIEQAGSNLEAAMDQLDRHQGKLGFMARGLQTRHDRIEDAILSTRALLSQIKDLDYTEAITEFQNLQNALQANLQTGGRILHTSLLDFLT